MEEKYASLTTPWSIGKCEIKNRVVITSMGGTSPINSMFGVQFDEKTVPYLIERAQNDIGLIIPGITPVKSLGKSEWLYDHPEVFEKLKPLVKQIHSYGSRIFIQLTAGMGRSLQLGTKMNVLLENKAIQKAAKPLFDLNDMLISPDDGAPDVWLPQYKTRGMTQNEIHEYVAAFALSALLCKEAGVDGVEIHAVHEGYLLDQFTLPYTNHREDAYGGSFTNRYRFPVEIVRAIKAVCGEDYPVSLRYSVTSKTKGYNSGAVPGEKFVEAGRSMEESEKAIRYLEEAGYDMFNCDNGTYDAWYWSHPPMYMPLNCNLQDVEHVKQFTSKPVVCAGRMEMETAAAAIAEGKIDAVGIARQSLCDPAFFTKLENGHPEDVRPCISCQNACMSMAQWKGTGCVFGLEEMKSLSHCALNPRTLNEKKYALKPARRPKHIAVIGAGIAGVEFALQASARGHTVDLYEKTDRIGGVFNEAAVPSFKEKDKELLKWYQRQLEYSEVNLILNHPIHSLKDISADEIVIATGAAPKHIPLKGSERAMNAIQALDQITDLPDQTGIIGGGLTGCEIAYELVLHGKHPFIIEAQDDIIKTRGVSAANSNMMRDLLRFHKVPVYLDASVREITEDSILFEQKEKTISIPADAVIMSVGYIPGSDLIKKERGKVHMIGDVSKVGNLKTAIWAANDLALKLSR